MGIKRHKIVHRFHKYKHTLVTKCTYTKLFQKTCWIGTYTKSPNLACFWGITFLCAFCHKGKFIFLKSMQNSASFDTHKVNIVKKFSYPYIVNDPNCQEQWWSGHWVEIIFFPFPYFLKGDNNPQGYACWKF
jgi:hypothetical protein